MDVGDIKNDDCYDVLMRTTLTIDEDVAAEIERIRQRERVSLKQAINDLLRLGLANRDREPRRKRYRSKPHRLRLRPGFDAAKLSQVVDELEAGERARREAELGG